MAKHRELARIDEARDTATIQVLDHALAPDWHQKPNRFFIVLLATFSMTALVIVYLLIVKPYNEFRDLSKSAENQ